MPDVGIKSGFLAILLTGCGPWVVPFPQPYVDPTNLPAVPDSSFRVGVGLSPVSGFGGLSATPSVLPLKGDLLGGTVRIDGGIGFGGWDIRAVANPMANGSQYDVRLGRRLLAGDRARLDVTAGFGATWYSDVYEDADTTLPYAYWAVTPHLGPRIAFRVTPRVEVPLVLEGSWSHVISVRGATEPSAWWLDAGTGGVIELKDGFNLGSGVDVAVSPDLRWIDTRVTFGVSHDFGFGKRGQQGHAPL